MAPRYICRLSALLSSFPFSSDHEHGRFSREPHSPGPHGGHFKHRLSAGETPDPHVLRSLPSASLPSHPLPSPISQDSLLAHCLSFLEADDLLRAEATCRTFKRAIEGHRLWAAKAATALPEVAHLINDMDTSDLEGSPQYSANPLRGMSPDDAALRRLSAGCKRLFSSAAATAEPETCSLISAAVASTSTDHPQEGVESMLYPVVRTQRLTCYWSSSGSASADSGEQVVFRLVHPLCLVTAVQLRPFRAFFQAGDPIYAPQRVSVGLGGLPFAALWLGPAPAAEEARARLNSRHFPRPPGHPGLHLAAARDREAAWAGEPSAPPPPSNPRRTWRDWMTLTQEVPVAQEDRVQTVQLPRRELCVGGYLHLNLLGRTQRQDADGLFYTCLGYVRAVGRPLYHFSVVSETLPGCVHDATPPAEALDQPLRLKVHARELLKVLGGIAHVSEYGRRRAGGMFAGDDSEEEAESDDEELEDGEGDEGWGPADGWGLAGDAEAPGGVEEEPEEGPPTPPAD